MRVHRPDTAAALTGKTQKVWIAQTPDFNALSAALKKHYTLSKLRIMALKNDLFLRALQGQSVDRPPGG